MMTDKLGKPEASSAPFTDSVTSLAKEGWAERTKAGPSPKPSADRKVHPAGKNAPWDRHEMWAPLWIGKADSLPLLGGSILVPLYLKRPASMVPENGFFRVFVIQ